MYSWYLCYVVISFSVNIISSLDSSSLNFCLFLLLFLPGLLGCFGVTSEIRNELFSANFLTWNQIAWKLPGIELSPWLVPPSPIGISQKWSSWGDEEILLRLQGSQSWEGRVQQWGIDRNSSRLMFIDSIYGAIFRKVLCHF